MPARICPSVPISISSRHQAKDLLKSFRDGDRRRQRAFRRIPSRQARARAPNSLTPNSSSRAATGPPAGRGWSNAASSLTRSGTTTRIRCAAGDGQSESADRNRAHRH